MLVCQPRFWVNNQSRMYLLEGTAALQHQYHLKSGDVLIFAQKADGTVVLAGRPPTPADAAKKPPLKRPSPMPSTSARPASNRPQVGLMREQGLLLGLLAPSPGSAKARSNQGTGMVAAKLWQPAM